MSSNDTFPAWKRQLYLYKAHVQLISATEDFTYFQISQAVSAKDNQFAEQDFVSSQSEDSNVVNTLKELNVTSVKYNEEKFEKYKQDTEALSGVKDAQEWKKKMEERKNAAKEAMIAALDATYDKAAAMIDQLPKSAQNSAFNVFDAGQHWVLTMFKTLIGQMNMVLDHIIDFMKGVWTVLKAAWETVQDASHKAIEFIKGILSFFMNSNVNNINSDDTTDIVLELVWNNSRQLSESQVAASVNYLRSLICDGYTVDATKPLSNEAEKRWSSTVTIKRVDDVKLVEVLQTAKTVIRNERDRVWKLTSWPEVPTPDPVSLNNSRTMPTQVSGGEGLSQRAAKSGGPLPNGLAHRERETANGH